MNMYHKTSIKSVMKVVARIVGIAIKTAPLFAGLIFSVGIISSLSQGIITVQTKRMFDSAVNMVSLETTFTKTVWQSALLCGIIILSQILNGLHNYVYDLYINVMKNKLGKRLNEKMNRMDPILFEDSGFLNMVNQAKVGMENSIEVILILGDVFTYYIPYFIFMGVYLFKIKPDFLWVLLLVFVPVLLAQVIRMNLYSRLENKSSKLRRRMSHYEECVSDIGYIKETRITSGLNYFKNKFMSVLKEYNNNITKTAKKANQYELILDSLTLVGYVYILWMLSNALFKNEITVGAFGAIYVSISSMFAMMEEIIRYNIGNIAENLGTVDHFVRFFNHETIEVKENTENYAGGIELKDITFHYPNQDKPAIDGLTLTIHPKETIAIVGENGSGKSTLINLILGLYHPTSGSVTVGGVKRVPKVLHYKGTSAVFQKFQKYKLNFDDNVRLSDFENHKPVEECLERVNIEGLYNKHKDTILSVEFDGIDLSLGQWQRIAIARGVYKNYEFITLDEPTASIDALEEDALYNKFRYITEDQTAIIVTHHLGSINFADRIIVMDQGKIVEEGSHEALMKQNGIYKKMFVAQSENYIKCNESIA